MAVWRIAPLRLLGLATRLMDPSRYLTYLHQLFVQPANFRFLSITLSSSLSRYRSEFYAYLSRLMLVTLSGIGPDNNRPFLDFLAPLTLVANNLISNLLLSGESQF